jgi:hypothetical protein
MIWLRKVGTTIENNFQANVTDITTRTFTCEVARVTVAAIVV